MTLVLVVSAFSVVYSLLRENRPLNILIGVITVGIAIGYFSSSYMSYIGSYISLLGIFSLMIYHYRNNDYSAIYKRMVLLSGAFLIFEKVIFIGNFCSHGPILTLSIIPAIAWIVWILNRNLIKTRDLSPVFVLSIWCFANFWAVAKYWF